MKLIQAEIIRKGFIGNDSRRLFHGRGHFFPGYEDIVIDWFSPVVLVTLYKQRDEVWLERLVVMLRSQIGTLEAVILQKRYFQDSPSHILFGELPAEINAVESGLNYRLRLNSAQNIGFFIDMAQGRDLVKKISVGKKVLNLFSYSCGFSVAALAVGASQVVNLDMNRGALELGRLNHRINNQDLRKVSFLQLELFRSFSKLRKLAPFDLIICDPPAEQGDNFLPQRDWSKLVRKLPELLKPEGEMLICLSSPYLTSDFIQPLFKEFHPQSRLLQTLYSGDDFPDICVDKGLNILLYKFS